MMLKLVGVLLVIAGVVALTMTWNYTSTVQDVKVGSIFSLQHQEEKTVQVPMPVGIALIVGGVALVGFSFSRK